MPFTGGRAGYAAEKTWAEHPELHDAAAIAWTTTPWTLPSNLALAVHPEVEYSLVKVGADGAEGFVDKQLLLASTLLGAYAKELGEYEVVATFEGAQLEGLEYEPCLLYTSDAADE